MGHMRTQQWATLVLAILLTAGLVLAGAAYANCGSCDKDKAKKAEEEQCDGPEWKSLFNGEDLTGWANVGGSVWTVEDKCLVGKQGPGNAPGDLFTKKKYGDFELVVTYKIQWPANSGVWFRYQNPSKAYQADILEYKDPECYSGTIYCSGKMFLAMNEDPKLVKKDDWNTIKIHAKGDHLVVSLNGKVTGDVHDGDIDKGRIGFQIHAGDQFKDMKITVKEMKIRTLSE